MSVSIEEINKVLQPGMMSTEQKFSDLIAHADPSNATDLFNMQQASAEFQMFMEFSSQLMKSVKDTGETIIRNT